jgi:hypothetical protein
MDALDGHTGLHMHMAGNAHIGKEHILFDPHDMSLSR